MSLRLVWAGIRLAFAAAAVSTGVTVAAPFAVAQQDTVNWSAYLKTVENAPRDTIPMNVYQGWKQYELNCSRCHGEYALGTSFAPVLIVSLKPDGSIPTAEMFIQVVCSGRPDKGMPSWCALGLELPTIQNIYSYVKGRSDGTIHPGRPALKSGG